MGYYSTITKFEQFQFQLPQGVTDEGVFNLFRNRDADHEEYLEELLHWFSFEVDSEGYLTMESTGESGKASVLPEALNALIELISSLQVDNHSGLEGLRFRFELWGEEAGDAVLYISDGKQLFSIQGEMVFLGDRVPVVS